MLRVGIVAGEPSGDYLGAQLISDIRHIHGDIEIEGVGGNLLKQAGCRVIYPMEKLAVIGLVEVAGRYFELRRMRRNLLTHFLDNPPDLFIGIDVPDFNLGLEQSLHSAGIKTVHYVSPSVWAWRKNRIKQIRKAVDLMLTLFPFEKDFYDDNGVEAVCVGHPLLDQVPEQPDKNSAREILGIAQSVPTVALLPGSRANEHDTLIPPFIRAAQILATRYEKIQFVCSMLDDAAKKKIDDYLSGLSGEKPDYLSCVDSMSDVLQAADVALLASGTVTLEAMLHQTPMVVAYKTNPLTFTIIKSMASITHVALPNILAGREIVPEYLQADCVPERLAEAMHELLVNTDRQDKMKNEFREIRNSMQRKQGTDIARMVLGVLQ